MFNFFLGVVVTLAVLYPSVTKHLTDSAIDTAHTTVTTVIKDTPESIK